MEKGISCVNPWLHSADKINIAYLAVTSNEDFLFCRPILVSINTSLQQLCCIGLFSPVLFLFLVWRFFFWLVSFFGDFVGFFFFVLCGLACLGFFLVVCGFFVSLGFCCGFVWLIVLFW